MNECLESVKIIQQVCNIINLFIKTDWVLIPVKNFFNAIEGMILSFIFIFLLVKDSCFVRSEAPKGELGLFIVSSSNIINVYRVKIRSPD